MVVGQTLSANLFTLPVTIMIFGEVSLIAPVANLLCAMPASAMMVCGGLAAVSFPVGFLHFLTYPLAFAAGIIGKYLIATAHLLAQLPYASVPANQPYVILWLVGTLILVGFVLLFRRSRRTARLTALISIIMLCSGIFSSQVLELGVTRITVMDVGNGTSLVISRGNRAAVIGCGGAFNAAPLVYYYLRDHNVRRMDALILPMMTEQYASAAAQLLADCPADAVMAGENGPLAEGILRQAKNSRILSADSCEISLWEDVTITMQQQEKGVVLLLTCGETKVLFCSSDADVQKFGGDSSDIQAVVLESSLPVNYQELHAPVALVYGRREDAAKVQLQLLANEVNSAAAADGTLEIATKGDGIITIRRYT
ncbi:MAG: hypothetical protein HFE85_01585 [Clostridiales bacterium]|nr:hypothetical protein [Clostridiales bacterium]